MFVLTGSESSPDAPRLSAREVLLTRAREGRWPLNLRTPHQRDLKSGDRIVFYVSGSRESDRTAFIGTAEVLGSRLATDRTDPKLPARFLARAVLYDVPIGNLRLVSEAVSARPLVGRLEFVKNKEKWGTYFQGGVRRIPQSDFDLIVAHADRKVPV